MTCNLTTHYRPTTTAAPAPNNAAIPTAPLAMLPYAAAVLVLALGAVVVAEIPDVKGTFDTEETPAKAIAWLVAVGTGVAVVLEGLSTLEKLISHLSEENKGWKGLSYLSITCITPFATMISVIMTCALLAKTFPSSTKTLTLSPITVGKLSFANPLVNKLLYPTVPLIT